MQSTMHAKLFQDKQNESKHRKYAYKHTIHYACQAPPMHSDCIFTKYAFLCIPHVGPTDLQKHICAHIFKVLGVQAQGLRPAEAQCLSPTFVEC